MVLIMIPIGLVAAFAIAIALMTTVLRKIREIGLLVAMGGTRLAVGMIFCMQGFIIGALGAFWMHYGSCIYSVQGFPDEFYS